MLYDPRWDKQIGKKNKPAVFSLAGLIAWLEQQPANKSYDFTDLNNCLLTQYFKSQRLGRFVQWTGCDGVHYWIGSRKFPPGFYRVALGGGSRQTFGAALERARSLALQNDQKRS